MNKYNIGIWGQFGDGGQIADGQAVRTTIITNELKDRYGENNIKVLNTNRWKYNPISFLIKTLILIFESKKIIIFPADNGFRVIVPIINILNKFLNKEIYYVVIGGFLPELLSKNKIFINMLTSFRAIFVQTNNLKKDLEKFGLKNIYILSNLKNINKIDELEMTINNNEHVKVCTLSRVTYSKGIEDAIIGVKEANKKMGGTFIKLDVYGMIDEKYRDRFYKLVDENKTFVSYKGIVDYNKTVECLKEYFILLFPTFFKGEGLPGNIVDAFHAGVPIIATDWLYNSDILINNYNGILVPINSVESISNALIMFFKDREFAYNVGLNNLNEAKKYSSEIVLKELLFFLDN